MGCGKRLRGAGAKWHLPQVSPRSSGMSPLQLLRRGAARWLCTLPYPQAPPLQLLLECWTEPLEHVGAGVGPCRGPQPCALGGVGLSCVVQPPTQHPGWSARAGQAPDPTPQWELGGWLEMAGRSLPTPALDCLVLHPARGPKPLDCLVLRPT